MPAALLQHKGQNQAVNGASTARCQTASSFTYWLQAYQIVYPYFMLKLREWPFLHSTMDE
jgi:hypothetical protein